MLWQRAKYFLKQTCFRQKVFSRGIRVIFERGVIFMQWFRNLQTRTKMISLISVMSIFLIGVGFIGCYASHRITGAMNDLYQQNLLAVMQLNAMRAYVRALESLQVETMIPTLAAERGRAVMAEMQTRGGELDASIESFMKLPVARADKDKLEQARKELMAAREGRKAIVELVAAGKKDAAYAEFLKEVQPRLSAANLIFREMATEHQKGALVAIEKSNELANTSIITVGIVAAVAVILSLALGLLVVRMITRPLSEVVAGMGEMAKGNLSAAPPLVRSRDEIGQVAQAVGVMQANLRTLLKQFAQSAENMAAASEELTASASQSAQAANQVAASIAQVAQGSEKQLTAVDNTAAVVQQMSAGIQQVASNAGNVSEVADKTSQAGHDGKSAIEQVITQMDSIGQGTAQVGDAIGKLSASSKQIGEIVGVISAIAAQTNLLALNAAIEAARAGEQGRGFAVVADEVRKLAEQSGDAAKQISSLIDENRQNIELAVVAMQSGNVEVKRGIEIVGSAGDAFTKIAALVQEVSVEVREISAAVEEMASGSEQMVGSMKDIERVSKSTAGETQTVSAATQEQSASMHEIATASQNLAKMAEGLQVAIAGFRL